MVESPSTITSTIKAINMGRNRVSKERKRATNSQACKAWRDRLRGGPPVRRRSSIAVAEAPAAVEDDVLLDDEADTGPEDTGTGAQGVSECESETSEEEDSGLPFPSFPQESDEGTGDDDASAPAGPGADASAESREILVSDVSHLMSKLHPMGLSHDGCQSVYDFILERSADVVKVQQDIDQEGGVPLPSSVRAIRRAYMKKLLPKVWSIAYVWVSASVEQQLPPTEVLPRDTSKYGRLHHKVHLNELREFVMKLHGDYAFGSNRWRKVDISVDGVPVGNSSTTKLLVVSIMFCRCATPFVIDLHHTLQRKHGPDAFATLKPVIQELAEAGMTLRLLRGDGVERKRLRCFVACCGKRSCDFCKAPGVRVRNVTYYPFESSHGKERRTTEGTRYIAGHLLELTEEERAGVRGSSPLLDIPNFDMVWSVPLDSMHTVDEGVVKKLLKLIFETDCPDLKEKFDEVFRLIKVPTEQPRKPREFDAKWKMSELNLVGLFISICFFDHGGILFGQREYAKIFLFINFVYRWAWILNGFMPF